MKPKCTASDGDSIACYKTSEEGCPFNESKISDEELGRFSSEFITKTNAFFELHNSFLYDEALENASGLENYLSDDSFSGVKVDGNYSDKIETVEDENSNLFDSQILYSSSKRYGLEKVKEISDLPPAREICNKARNTITFDAALSKNNAINIKFPMSSLSDAPENLAAYRSVRLNKKYRLKKTVRKSRSKKFIVSAKTMECFSSEEISESEKPELENTTAVRASSKINYSLVGTTKNERQVKSTFVNKSKSSKYFGIMVEENISQKSKLRVSSRLAKKSAGEAPGNKKGALREKSDPQNKAKIKVKSNEKNTSKNKAALENYDDLRQNINVEDMDLFVNEIESDLVKNEVVATDKKRDVEQLLQSFPSKESNIDTVNLKSVEAVKESSTKNSHLGRKRPNNDNAAIMPSKKGKRNQVVKRNSEKNVKGKTSSNENFDEHYNTETTKQQLDERVVVSKPSGRSSKRNKKIEEESTDMAFKLKNSLNDVGTDLCNQKRSKRGKKYSENVNSSAESHSLYSSPNVIQSTFKMNLRPRKYTAVKSADTQNSRKTITKSVCMSKKTAAVKTEDTLRESSIVKNTILPLLSKKVVVVTADKASGKKTKIYKKISSNEKAALNNESENSNVEDTALLVNKIRSGFITNKIAAEKASETKNKVDKRNSSKKKPALTNYRENSIVEDRALSVKEIESDVIKNKIVADEKRNGEELLHSNPSKENNIDAIIFKSVDAVKESSAKNSTLRKKRSNEGNAEILPSKRRKRNQELVKRNFKCQICSSEDSDELYNAKITKKQSAENVEVSKPSGRRTKRSKKLEEESTEMTFKLKNSLKDISSHFYSQETSETAKKHIGNTVSSGKSHSSYNSPHVIQSTSNRPRKYTAVKSADTQNSRKTKNKSDCMSKKTAAVKTGGTLRENNIVEHTSLPIKYIEMDFSKHEIEITTQKTFVTKVKVEKKNSPNKKAALNNERENSIVEDTAFPVKEIGNDFIENKIVTSDKTFETKNKFDKKKLAKRTTELLSNRENSLVEDTALPVKEIGRDFIKNKIAIANKTFETKFKVEKKIISKKKVVLKNEDIFREENLDEHTYLPVNEIVAADKPANEIVAADKSLDEKMKFEKKTVSWENGDILYEKGIAENTDLPATNKIVSNVINNKTASGENHKSKSIHLFETRKLESQNPSMENTFACINEKTSGTRMSGTTQSNSSIFLQLFDKIAKLANSETFSKTNPSIAKLVEQRNNSKFATPSTICKELNNKRGEEQLLAEVAPLKKRKQDQEVIQRNSEKIHKGIISSNRDAVEHYNSKTTAEQSAESNKKLEKESNETTYKLTNSLKDVSTDLCNQEIAKKEKKYIENLNSSAEYHSSYNSPCDSTLKRNLGTRTCTTVKSANIHSSNKIKRKADSLVISSNPKSLHDDEKVDACSFIKKTDVDSMANLHENNSKNLKNKKSNNLFFDSISEDPNAIKTYKMQPNTNKPLHVSQHDKTFDISEWAQPEENASLKLSSDGNTTQSKSSLTFVDPNFYNEPKTPRKKKEDKSFSKQEKRTISEESANEHTVQSASNDVLCADTVSEERANEHTVQSGSNDGQFYNSSSNGVPISSLNSDQRRDFLSSCTLYPLSTHCKILYNHELNFYMLAVPIQSPLSLSAHMPTTSAKDNNVSSVFTPQTAPSVASTQNVPPLFTNQNVLSKVKPHTTSYAENPQNTFVTRSKELSGIPHSNDSVDDSSCCMRIRTTKTTRLVKVHQARDAVQKPESKLCINWESVIERSLELIDISFIDKLVEQRYGKDLKNCTVREFCSNPAVVHVLSKQLEFHVTDCEDPGRLDYNFHDSVLDEPLIRVLKDVALFFLEHVYEKTRNKYGDALRECLFSEIYAKFSVLVFSIFSNLYPATVQNFTFEKMIPFIGLTGIIYIFCRCQKNI